MKEAISKLLDEFVQSLDKYFPTRDSKPAWVRQPSLFNVEKADTSDEYLDKIIEIQQSHGQQQLFKTDALNVLKSPNRSVPFSFCLESP